MKGYLGINIFFPDLLDDPFLICFLMINLNDLKLILYFGGEEVPSGDIIIFLFKAL